MTRKTKIFLSYPYAARKIDIFNKFITDLKQLPNISIWLPDENIEIGDSIFSTVSKAISECDYFISIPTFIDSRWVNFEREFAYVEELKNQNLKIITVLLWDDKYYEKFITPRARGIFLNLAGNYEEGFKELKKYLAVNSSDNIAAFSLEVSINHLTIIDISSKVNDKLIAFFSTHPEKLKIMDRKLFEELIAELFLGFGFEVELTQQTRDGGRDIIAIKNTEAMLKYLIECKRPDPGNPIGIKPVRELFGVKQDEKATKAILATTSFFTKDAIMFFERNKWELEPKDFKGIIKWLDEYKRLKNIT
jgi:HJR/Mrr/RecB family endonuclease